VDDQEVMPRQAEIWMKWMPIVTLIAGLLGGVCLGWLIWEAKVFG